MRNTLRSTRSPGDRRGYRNKEGPSGPAANPGGASRRRWQGTSLKERRGNSTERGESVPQGQETVPEPRLVVNKQDHLSAGGRGKAGGTWSKMAECHLVSPSASSLALCLLLSGGNIPLEQQNHHKVVSTMESTSHGPAPNMGHPHAPHQCDPHTFFSQPGGTGLLEREGGRLRS